MGASRAREPHGGGVWVRTARCFLSRPRASEAAERSLWYPSMPEGRFVRTRESEALYWQRAASVAPSLENSRVSSANDHSNTDGTMKVEGAFHPQGGGTRDGGPTPLFPHGQHRSRAPTPHTIDLPGRHVRRRPHRLGAIRNGEVCYGPNLGYGRFGAKVSCAAPSKSLSAPTGAGRRLILTTRPATLQVRRS